MIPSTMPQPEVVQKSASATVTGFLTLYFHSDILISFYFISYFEYN